LSKFISVISWRKYGAERFNNKQHSEFYNYINDDNNYDDNEYLPPAFMNVFDNTTQPVYNNNNVNINPIQQPVYNRNREDKKQKVVVGKPKKLLTKILFNYIFPISLVKKKYLN
jgi:hypothetical protein